ncbi:MAG: hypothetical protein A2600_05485 [Candidatus Lambdaproteobacteria bacterium RIFOXYD1_FULL_56_27]|uniref:Ribonuclease G n=1 Tax=Candidatus Lambdaproteobacteria bacterium RIFOXYD2_FULL_56_26 TaxID=1817773 RepID=A0A1F6GR86_9PROT|nr:MAG: hypothetical protein A2426_10695 [Candidatus Lambdaproteobacteria bacterium RIFOXYC1_FULL_56_13]OGH00653.1 MAG: hypothetical protein A2557_03190 [Candidatus Lambdaproteobacteria bacterium RIFOXYD2_FULL_56_26]OGH07820.1 MAG: hypothetical protein A2600_05485 [Candidatus Lambdaproteobacteria bacterium RIFOXYD1_FULL_56_27]
MTKKMMLIMASDDESRIALVEDQLLQEMLIEHQSREQIKGNIYKARVVQIQTSVQAAFVDYGAKRHGFLPLSEVCPQLVDPNSKEAKTGRLKVGQQVLVQVTREEVDNKGAAMTMQISLPGRFMVLMPYGNKGGVSKKIEDKEERDRLKGFLSGLENEEHAAIIRTAGTGRDLSELKKDYTAIKKHWEDIYDRFCEAKSAGLLQEEEDVVTRSLRDYYTEDIEEIWVDNPMVFQKTLEFLKMAAPRKQKILKLYVGDRSLFSHYNIEKQVEQLTSREVRLKSGGSIVIDQTEALVSIDVNSGRSNQESNVDDTALRTNLEAAEEVARQLRLRNLGGLVVVDFIDMEKDKSRRMVEDKITESMARDKAQHKILPISQFGLLEISRQRMSVRISNVVESTCPFCKGKGKVPSLLAATNLILRHIRELAARGNVERVTGELPLGITNHLLNERRKEIIDLEHEFGIEVHISANPMLHMFEENMIKAVTDGPPKKRAEDHPRREESERSRSRSPRPRWAEEEKDEAKAEVNTPVEASQKEEGEESGDAADRGRNRNRGRGRGRGRGRDRERGGFGQEQIEGSRSESFADTEETEEYRPKSHGRAEPMELLDLAPLDSPLYKGAIFNQLNSYTEEQLDRFFLDFQLRLKGKAKDKKPFVVPERYLWRSVGKPLTEDPPFEELVAEEVVVSVPKPAKVAAVKEEEIAVEEEIEEGQEPSEEGTASEGERPKRKRNRGSRGRKKRPEELLKAPVIGDAPEEEEEEVNGNLLPPKEEEPIDDEDQEGPSPGNELEPPVQKAAPRGRSRTPRPRRATGLLGETPAPPRPPRSRKPAAPGVAGETAVKRPARPRRAPAKPKVAVE